jgi:hypothetical protein
MHFFADGNSKERLKKNSQERIFSPPFISEGLV